MNISTFFQRISSKKFKIVSLGSAMADLALLLLIFFMASTTSEPPKGVEVNLPSAMIEPAQQDSLYISISRQGNLYFDGNKTTLDEFKDQLAMRQSEKDRTVSFSADKNLDYNLVAGVLETLQAQGFLNIVFMAIMKKGGI